MSVRTVKELVAENQRLKDQLAQSEERLAVFKKERDGLFQVISGLEVEVKELRSALAQVGVEGLEQTEGDKGVGEKKVFSLSLEALDRQTSPVVSPQTSPRFEPLDDVPDLSRGSRRRKPPSPPGSARGRTSAKPSEPESSGVSPPRGLASKLKSTFARQSKRADVAMAEEEIEVQLARGSMLVGDSANNPVSVNVSGSGSASSIPPVAAAALAPSSVKGTPPTSRFVSPALSRRSNSRPAPLPPSDEVPSATFASPALSRKSASDAEIHIQIVDTVSVLHQSKKVTLYVLQIDSQDGDSWKLARRYNAFHALFADLQAKTSLTLTFPPKKFAVSMDEEKAKKRLTLLQKFLDQIVLMKNLTATLEFARFIDPMESPSVIGLRLQDVRISGSLMQLVEVSFNQLERQKRFLVIVQAKLFYFREKSSIEPLGKVELDYCVTDFEGQLDSGNFGFSVKHMTMNRPIIFEGTEEACKKWVSAIRQARLAIVGGVELDSEHAASMADSLVAVDSSSFAEAELDDSQGASLLRRFAHGRSVRLSTFATVPDTVSSIQGSVSFSEPDSEENVVFKEVAGEGKVISAASVQKLIEKLTLPEVSSMSQVRFFLLTYRVLMSPQELLAYLLARYHNEDLIGARRGFRGGGLTRNAIHDRICDVLELWLDLNFHEFVEEADLTARVMSFVYNSLEGNILMNEKAECIKNMVKTRVLVSEDEKMAKQETFLANAPKVLMPNMLGVGLNYLLDLDPLEMARQIAILDHELFSKIHPAVELVGQKWSKEKTRHLAPNVMTVIERFNSVSSWVASSVLQATEAATRAALLTRLVSIAEALVQLRAFGPACAMVGGLLSPPLMRLKKTSELLTDDTRLALTELEKLISAEKNHKHYRGLVEATIKARLPCVPYLGLYLADLTFIEDGNPDYRGELVNVDKRMMVGKVLSEIIGLQGAPYCLRKVPALQYFLMSQRPADETKIYQMSLEREPREKR